MQCYRRIRPFASTFRVLPTNAVIQICKQHPDRFKDFAKNDLVFASMKIPNR
ncbi:MAG: hypothetical protein ACRC2R_12815 [Xenococcaceae cyanobacterium]